MTEKTEVELLESDPKASADLAAAHLTNLVGALMDAVDKQCSEYQADIARAMGVTPGRVSQLINGDGNVRVSTLARLLDACGYELSLTATPKPGRSGSPVTMPRPARKRVETPEGSPKDAATAHRSPNTAPPTTLKVGSAEFGWAPRGDVIAGGMYTGGLYTEALFGGGPAIVHFKCEDDSYADDLAGKKPRVVAKPTHWVDW